MQQYMGDEKWIHNFSRKNLKERSFAKHKRRWKDNIKPDLKEMVYGNVD